MGKTALAYTCEKYNPSIVADLLNAGADTELESVEGGQLVATAFVGSYKHLGGEKQTPFDYALEAGIKNKSLAVISLLIQHGAIIKNQDKLMMLMSSLNQESSEVKSLRSIK